MNLCQTVFKFITKNKSTTDLKKYSESTDLTQFSITVKPVMWEREGYICILHMNVFHRK